MTRPRCDRVVVVAGLLLALLISACASTSTPPAPATPAPIAAVPASNTATAPPTPVEPTPETPVLTPAPALGGRLWIDLSVGVLWQMDLASGRVSRMNVADDVFPIQPTTPLSGAPLAYAGARNNAGMVDDRYGIYIDARRVLTVDDNISYQDPTWSADGNRLYVTRIGVPPGQPVGHTSGLNIQVLDAQAGLAARTVVTEALQPAPSYDGRWLAYVRVDVSDPENPLKSIRVRNLATGEDRQVLAPDRFTDIFGPRWLPGDTQLVFAALASPDGQRTSPPGLWGVILEALDSLFKPRIAAAHSWAGDIWRVGSDGQGLTQLTNQSFLSPVPAPAPDGDHIAILSMEGIWVMRTDGSGLTRISDDGTNGSIEWSH